MEKVRFGVVGLGNMGSFHVDSFPDIKGAELSAICDASPTNLENAGKKTPAKQFSSWQEMLDSGLIDAILIATPHFLHPEVAIAAMGKGIHVLCEKPLAVTVKQGRAVVQEAAKNPNVKFAMMLQQRTMPIYRKLRQLIVEGELGQISRLTWIVTDWFRTWAYYASGGWRATWAGEGGGVLINQCPHNLDLMQWLTGLVPSRATAVGFIGKTHPIEVEDEVSAILEYPDGAIGHFITSTGEAPGTNRLEIVGNQGRIVAENDKLRFSRTRKGVRETRQTSKDAFVRMETWDIDIPYAAPGEPEGHKAVTQNFVNAILKGEALIATGADGLRQLELGNGILMSALTRKPVDLPIDAEAYEDFLADMTKTYSGKKTLKTEAAGPANMAASFQR
jgi:predicted dehydrogenase